MADNLNKKNDDYRLTDKVLNDIKSRLDDNNLQDKSIRIVVGKENSYRGVIGDLSAKNNLNSESLDKLQKALYEPEKLEGSVRIYGENNKVLYHVTSGIAHKDELQMFRLRNQTQSESVSQKTEQPLVLENIQNQVKSIDQQVQEEKKQLNSQEALNTLGVQSEKTLESINKLQETVQKQQEMINKLTKSLEDAIKTNNPNPENSKLQNFVGAVEHKFKEFAKGALNQIKQFIQPALDRVTSTIDGIKNKITNAKNTFEEGVKKTVNTVASKALEANGKAIEASVGTMLKAVGEKQGDGSISFSSENYNFRMEGDAISVHRKSDGAEILNKGEFTSHTLKEDLKNMDKVESVAQKYTYEVAESQQQQQSKSISR